MEAKVQLFDAFVENREGHLDTKEGLEDGQDLQLALNGYLEQQLEQEFDVVRVGHVLEHLQRVGCLSGNLHEDQNHFEISTDVRLLLVSSVKLDKFLAEFGHLGIISREFDWLLRGFWGLLVAIFLFIKHSS